MALRSWLAFRYFPHMNITLIYISSRMVSKKYLMLSASLMVVCLLSIVSYTSFLPEQNGSQVCSNIIFDLAMVLKVFHPKTF